LRYRAAPEAAEARRAGSAQFAAFADEALPAASEEQRTLAADLIERTLTSVGSSFSEHVRTADEITRYSDGLADMLGGYLMSVRGGAPNLRLAALSPQGRARR
jgi:hypothetical protein